MKKIYKSIVALLLVFTLMVGETISVSAVTNEKLNNQDKDGINYGVIDKDHTSTDFVVNISGARDTVKIYKIANMVYNETQKDFDAPVWTTEVLAWVNANATYKAYNTPSKLGAQAENVQTDFFKALFDGDIGMKTTWSASDVWDSTVNNTSGSGLYIIRNQEIPAEGDPIDLDSYTIKDAEIGIYIAITENEGKTKHSAPTIINLIPEKDPTGKWYLDQEIAVSAKSSDIYMHKYINDRKSDIVAIGETVDFSIDFKMPVYGERDTSVNKYILNFQDDLSDAFTLDQNSVKVEYSTDGESWTVMDDKYYSSLIAAPAKDIDDYGITIWGCGYYDLYLFTIYRLKYKHYDSMGKKNDEKGAYDDFYAYYYYKDGSYQLLTNDSEKDYDQLYGNAYGYGTVAVPVTPSATQLTGIQVRALYSNATRDTVTHGWYVYYADGTSKYVNSSSAATITGENTSYRDTTYYTIPNGMTGREYAKSLFHNLFNITFDVDSLIKERKKDSGFFYKEDNEIEVRITYQAEVNQNIATGSELNTNTATMKYELNGSGTLFGNISDTVHAYTYGLNLVKLDGATVDSDNPTPLKGAKFRIYREAYVFKQTKEDAVKPEESQEGAVLAGSFAKTDMTGLTIDTTTLASYKASHDGQNFYYITETMKEAGTLDASYPTTVDEKVVQKPVTYEAGDVITRVFLLYTLADKNFGTYLDGTIESIDSTDGITVKGLLDGNYILTEYMQPAGGYNLLAEDILFSIRALDADIANSAYDGSYAVFADEGAVGDGEEKTQKVTDDDGIYELTVLNYKGLTLPSTGGMGTLIFTIAGIMIMLLAVVLILRKGRAVR